MTRSGIVLLHLAACGHEPAAAQEAKGGMVFVPERRELRLSLGRIPAAKGPFVTLRPWE